MPLALQCPACQQVPAFHGGHRTTAKRGVRCAFFVGCSHVAALVGFTLFEETDGNAVLARWNAEAERLFATSTAHWTEAQRTTFRRKLDFPNPSEPAPDSRPLASVRG